jgi:PilZ domain
MSSDSRAHPRYALEVDAEVRTQAGKIPARTRDVSRGGLALTLGQDLPLGTELTLNLALVFDEETFSEPLLLRARVVWCTRIAEKYQIGTTFVAMTAEQRAYLDMFMRYLAEGKRRAAAEAATSQSNDGSNDDNPFG